MRRVPRERRGRRLHEPHVQGGMGTYLTSTFWRRSKGADLLALGHQDNAIAQTFVMLDCFQHALDNGKLALLARELEQPKPSIPRV